MENPDPTLCHQLSGGSALNCSSSPTVASSRDGQNPWNSRESKKYCIHLQAFLSLEFLFTLHSGQSIVDVNFSSRLCLTVSHFCTNHGSLIRNCTINDRHEKTHKLFALYKSLASPKDLKRLLFCKHSQVLHFKLSGMERKETLRMMLRFVLLAVLFLEWSLAEETCADIVKISGRKYKFSITSFGAKGDGKTLNTHAFMSAVSVIKRTNLRSSRGCMLYVPPGVWLTGPFNLTSHMTLYLAKNAVIKASQDTKAWPVISPLPSYGRGRELPGGRYMSFIHADSVTDVFITGKYGTIDGRGELWWKMWRSKTLKYTRGSLIGIVNSKNIKISNVVLQNSPFWTLHPVYCSNVVIQGVKIMAPQDAPNTDGIVPDSSDSVCIEDCEVTNGDDAVAIKSGWDQYGISFGRPSKNIVIRRLRAQTQGFSGIAIGSETSGGVRNVMAKDIRVYDSAVGIRLKTTMGRGGVIRNITITGVSLENVRTAIKFSADAGEHPDNGWNRSAVPVVKNIAIMNVVGSNIGSAGDVKGFTVAPMTGICLFNVSLQSPPVTSWHCGSVTGSSVGVSPATCSNLKTTFSKFCRASYGRFH